MQAWKTWNFIKKILKHKCSYVNIATFLKTAFLENTSGGYFHRCNTVHCNNKNQHDVFCWFPGFLIILFPEVVHQNKRFMSLNNSFYQHFGSIIILSPQNIWICKLLNSNYLLKFFIHQTFQRHAVPSLLSKSILRAC